MREQHSDVANLAVVGDRHEEDGGGVERLDQLAADLVRGARIRHALALPRGDHLRGAGGAAVELQVVLGGVAAGPVLRDLEQVDLVDRQRLRERADQRTAELGGGTGLCRGRGDAVQRGLGAGGARS
jgi:hypothetical protein